MMLKNVVAYCENMRGKIKPCYSLNTADLQQLLDYYGGGADLAMSAFRWGYIQGMKAQESDMKKPTGDLKRKDDIRKAVYGEACAIKNIYMLRELYEIADVLRRSRDDIEYATLTEAEWNKISIIKNIMACIDEKALGKLNCFVSSFLSNRKKG